jgi:hypothetical protein
MQPRTPSRTLISLLVVAVLLSGLMFSPAGNHGSIDFYLPVVFIATLPIPHVTLHADAAPRITDRFSGVDFPAAPDRAPPSVQTVLSI